MQRTLDPVRITEKQFRLRGLLKCAIVLCCVAGPFGIAVAGDWSTYMHDNSRAGYTSDTVQTPLQLRWTISAEAALQKAFSGPDNRTIEMKELRDRVTYDDA
jgi:hypothetical protein